MSPHAIGVYTQWIESTPVKEEEEHTNIDWSSNWTHHISRRVVSVLKFDPIKPNWRSDFLSGYISEAHQPNHDHAYQVWLNFFKTVVGVGFF